MTGRIRLAAILAALILLISFAAAGCADGGIFRHTKNGGLEYPEGNSVWSWARSGSTAQITLDKKLFAVIQSGIANVSLPDGRTLDVILDGKGNPVSIKAPWGVQLTQQDYAQMSTAFYVNNQAGGMNQTGSLGWVVFLLLVILAGVLLFLYSGTLVNNWKLGGIFSGNDTARSLLIFKAVGIIVVVVGAVILLAVIF